MSKPPALLLLILAIHLTFLNPAPPLKSLFQFRLLEPPTVRRTLLTSLPFSTLRARLLSMLWKSIMVLPASQQALLLLSLCMPKEMYSPSKLLPKVDHYQFLPMSTQSSNPTPCSHLILPMLYLTLEPMDLECGDWR